MNAEWHTDNTSKDKDNVESMEKQPSSWGEMCPEYPSYPVAK